MRASSSATFAIRPMPGTISVASDGTSTTSRQPWLLALNCDQRGRHYYQWRSGPDTTKGGMGQGGMGGSDSSAGGMGIGRHGPGMPQPSRTARNQVSWIKDTSY